jgi:hypothetical protein
MKLCPIALDDVAGTWFEPFKSARYVLPCPMTDAMKQVTKIAIDFIFFLKSGCQTGSEIASLSVSAFPGPTN